MHPITTFWVSFIALYKVTLTSKHIEKCNGESRKTVFWLTCTFSQTNVFTHCNDLHLSPRYNVQSTCPPTLPQAYATIAECELNELHAGKQMGPFTSG